MTLDQVLEQLKHPLSAYARAMWDSGPDSDGMLVLFKKGDAFAPGRSVPDIVHPPDGLTDTEGFVLANEFNALLATMKRLKGPRNV